MKLVSCTAIPPLRTNNSSRSLRSPRNPRPSTQDSPTTDSLHSFAYDTTVTVLVGPDSEPFQIHRALACQHRFFSAAYCGIFVEANGTLSLPDQDPAIFRWFSYWLYTGRLCGYHYPPTAQPTFSSLVKVVERELQQKGLPKMEVSGNVLRTPASTLLELAKYRDVPFDKLIGLYLLADYLQIPRLQDMIVDALVLVYGFFGVHEARMPHPFWSWWGCQRPDWLPHPVPVINAVWDVLGKEAKLCRLLVTLFCDNVVDTAVTLQGEESLDPDFLTAAFTQIQGRRGGSSIRRTDWFEEQNSWPYYVQTGPVPRGQF